MKRLFDIVTSFVFLIILLPIFLLIGICVILDSRGGAFYLQERIGKNEVPFKMFKFRTMAENSDKKGLLTIGNEDSRVTKIGSFLRKFKLDELPQLWNVLKGDMSIVGPRPEVQKYVALYNMEQKKVLSVKPGITDYASFDFINEGEILSQSNNPEKTYIEEILPQKINLSLAYIQEQSFWTDLKIIFKTIRKIVN